MFSRNVVLNITRKQREWRFYEFLGLRHEDLPKATAVLADIRKIIKQVCWAPWGLWLCSGTSLCHPGAALAKAAVAALASERD